ncbi:MAG: LysM peptidoglycan-binding domain-containing protein [Chloroflexota bacterium]|nr:MAG: LysM peptidoglycan-binding domain-containing protein [Chloroflexota bacterium]
MKNGFLGISSVLVGALAAGFSIILVLGGILLAFAEGRQSNSFASYPTLESIDINTPALLTPSPTVKTAILQATATRTIQPTETSIITPSSSLAVTSCKPPEGWVVYIVQSSDTLNKLSAAAGLTPQALADANCLSDSRLDPGMILFMPPIYPTTTVVTCGPPSYWLIYIVQAGDTLFNIAQRVGSTVSQIKAANCLISDQIRTGQRLFVPRLPVPTLSPTAISPTEPPPSATSTPIPSITPTDNNISVRTPPSPIPSP